MSWTISREGKKKERKGKRSVRNFLRRRSLKGESQTACVYTCVCVYRDTCVTIGVIGVATVAPRRGVLLIGPPSRHPSRSEPSFLPSLCRLCRHATRENDSRGLRDFEKTKLLLSRLENLPHTSYDTSKHRALSFRDSSRLFSVVEQ